MAFFCNKLGGLLKQSVVQTNGMSMLNAARMMSSASSKLFVGGLSWGTDDQALKDAFSGFGDVTEARVIVDRETGKSRGFGFVSFAETESADSAVSAMDGQELNGRSIRVNIATDKPRNSGGFGGGGAYGGGYNNGGGGGGGGGYNRGGYGGGDSY